ncbi:MAG: hypothetical protein ACQUHE_05485 [Bacteroidia bacterium]
MRNNYPSTTTYCGAISFAFILIVSLNLFVQSANAQTFYNSVSASKLNMIIGSSSSSTSSIKSEGSYLIKDGQLDEIYKLKLILPSTMFDSLGRNKNVSFEQKCVMILPIMGMVHFVGIVDIDGIKGTTSFQLSYKVGADQSITFSGNKSLKLKELAEGMPNETLALNLDFVLKNSRVDLALNTTK